MFWDELWDELKLGVSTAITLFLVFATVPSGALLGIHLMGKLIPALAPTCEVRK